MFNVPDIDMDKKKDSPAGTDSAPKAKIDIDVGFEGVDPDKPMFPIGTAATMLEVHPRTLRIYEDEGLIKPWRKGGRRYYSLNDIQWIKCLRHMIHDQGISIAGIKKLMQYTSCWNIVDCPMEKRKRCTAYQCSGIGMKTGD